MATIDEDILREFLAECREYLEQVERDLVVLERDPKDSPRIAGVFRAFHSIKGTCGFFGFTRLAAVTHAGETLLSRLRSGEQSLTPEVADALLALVDAVRAILGRIEATHEEGEDEFAGLIERFHRLQGIGGADPVTAAAPPLSARKPPSESSIRVEVQLLDLLMNLVGELVLARNQLLLHVSSKGHADLSGTVQRLNHVTTELQERIVKTRMQPIDHLCSSLPRLVRDVAATCGKQVRLELEGVDTELDRAIIEALRDPLTHLIRNAIDHGIESGEVRAAHGKPAMARLLVRAFHEGGKVHIEVRDDGAGLPLALIREFAIRNDLVPSDRVANLTDRDWANMIFLPGFSTAERVTDVSGRGVGMDVVKTNVEKIGGTIDVESKPDEGTTVRIHIPLTLAIVPALVVGVGEERYAIPQVNLIELVRVGAAEGASRVVTAYNAPMLRYRNGLLPLLDLGKLLQVKAGDRSRAAADACVAVVHADGGTVGLIVDTIDASQEIVVKPLGEPLLRIPVFAGATILGDGTVALILDIPGLARHAGVTRAPRPPVEAVATAAIENANMESRTLVVCRASERWTVAIPQEQIARLEELSRAEMERVGDRAVIQYRGDILPLVSLGALLDLGGAPNAADIEWIASADPLRVIVHERDGQRIGLVVESIVEIVEKRVARREGATRTGLVGATVVGDSVTELLDLQALLRSTDVERHAVTAAPGAGGR